MALTINQNTMNPVPIWPDKSYWQCKQKTFHDAMAWPVVENGMLPSIALTMKGTPAGVQNIEMTITDAGVTMPYVGAIPSNWDGLSTIVLVESGNSYPQIRFIPQGGDMYKLEWQTSSSIYDLVPTSGRTVVSREELKQGGNYTADNRDMYLSPVDLNYLYEVTRTITIKRFTDDGTAGSFGEVMRIRGCVPYRTAERNGRVWIGGHAVSGTFADGVYYLQFTLDGTTYYSEPFMWLTSPAACGYTHIQHRSSRPIVTTENVVWFDNGDDTAKWLDMWVNNIEQRPPYQFFNEVEDIDGRRYMEKQVSYRLDHLVFLCFEAFLDAVRMLWHCDIRTVAGKRVDYMEQPEVDWSNDNHLAQVTLEMQSDTVMQTNGTASAYADSSDSQHSSYDNSFDSSFD